MMLKKIYCTPSEDPNSETIDPFKAINILNQESLGHKSLINDLENE